MFRYEKSSPQPRRRTWTSVSPSPRPSLRASGANSLGNCRFLCVFNRLAWISRSSVRRLGGVNLPKKIGTCYDVAFSPDDASFATIGRSVWLYETLAAKKRWRSHPFANPSHLAFSPDGLSLAVKSTSGEIAILDAPTGEVRSKFGNHDDGDGANITYSPCGEYIVDATWTGRIIIRNAHTGAVQAQGLFPDMIVAVHSTPDRSVWVFQHSPRATRSDAPPPPDYLTVWKWPLTSGGFRICQLSSPFVRASALSPDGSKIAIVHGAPPKTLSLVAISDSTVIWESSPISVSTWAAVQWSPNGDYLAVMERRAAALYNSRTSEKVWETHMDSPMAAAFSSDGTHLVLGSTRDGLVFNVARELNMDFIAPTVHIPSQLH